MKTKTQISFAVTAKLISVFVFATLIVQSLYFLSTKLQASSHLLCLYSPVCVGPGRIPRRQVFSQRGSNKISLCSQEVNISHTSCMSRIMRKPAFCICKDSDKLWDNHAADQRQYFCYIDTSTIPLLSESEISRL